MERIHDYIYKHPTEYYNTHLYYFPMGEWEPRLEWLNEQISKL
jgi:hypothetical protein